MLFPLEDPSSEVTTFHFDILLKEEVVGSLKATRSFENSMVYYNSSTSLEIKIIKDFEVNYSYEVSFENGFMQKSDVDITVNQKPHAQTTAEWVDNTYVIEKDHKKDITLKDSVIYSTVMLYFKEPLDIKKCFSEQDGSFNDLVPLGNHSYKKINSKGRENIYQYNNGSLKHASIDGGIMDFQIVARE